MKEILKLDSFSQVLNSKKSKMITLSQLSEQPVV